MLAFLWRKAFYYGTGKVTRYANNKGKEKGAGTADKAGFMWAFTGGQHLVCTGGGGSRYESRS